MNLYGIYKRNTMRKLALFVLVYHDVETDKVDYCYVFASDEEHARHEFIRQYQGKKIIMEIIRQHDAT